MDVKLIREVFSLGKVKDFFAHLKTKFGPKIVFVVIPLAILIFLGLAFAFQPVRVRTGERTICKYGEILVDKTKLVTVPRLFAGAYKIKINTATCAKHRACKKFYDKALEAIDQGDYKTAGVFLGAIEKLDPEFKDIKVKLNKANKELAKAGTEPPIADSGASASGDSSSSAGTSSDSPPAKKSDSMKQKGTPTEEESQKTSDIAQAEEMTKQFMDLRMKGDNERAKDYLTDTACERYSPDESPVLGGIVDAAYDAPSYERYEILDREKMGEDKFEFTVRIYVKFPFDVPPEEINYFDETLIVIKSGDKYLVDEIIGNPFG